MIRILGWLFGFGVFCAVAGVIIGLVYLGQISANLPDYTILKDYPPPVTTRKPRVLSRGVPYFTARGPAEL